MPENLDAIEQSNPLFNFPEQTNNENASGFDEESGVVIVDDENAIITEFIAHKDAFDNTENGFDDEDECGVQ